MGKTILELFNSSKLAKQTPQPKPTSGYGDRGQFLIDRENRLGAMAEKMFDPKTETQLEQELSGLRPYRLVNEPTLYGTDMIRIDTQKTSDVDAMKISKNPNAQVSLGKIGKFIQKVNDSVNKALGMPQNVFPTYVINTKEFKESKTPNRMIALGQIRRDARGTDLGRFLKSTGGGTPNQIAKQSIGQGLNLAKGFVRTALVGNTEIPITSGSFGLDNPDTPDKIEGFQQKYYYSVGEYQGSYTYSMKAGTQPAAGATMGYTLASPSSLFRTDRKFNNNIFGAPLRYANKQTYGFQLSDGTGHNKFGEPSAEKLKNASNFQFPIATQLFDDYDKGKTEHPLLAKLKPKFLQRNNWKKDRYSKETSNQTKTYHGGGTSLYDDSLSKRRGLDSDRDVLNQTGRLSKAEQSSIKFNNKTLDQLDLIPLRFERVNDGGTVYFRSVVTGYNEAFSPSWESSKMLGSPFNFYSYTGVERKVTFNLKVYAMSQPELIMMWRRLEFLAHCSYPYQYNSGIIEPTLLYFTFGNVHVNKACFLDSLTYSIEDSENLWEIGGNGLGKVKKNAYEKSFGGKFYAGANNGEAKENGKADAGRGENGLNTSGTSGVRYDYKRNTLKESKTTGVAIESAPKNNSIANSSKLPDGTMLYQSNLRENENKIVADTAGINYNMDQYKLPKFINASVGLTFIETKGTTDNNIYGYGKSIGKGK